METKENDAELSLNNDISTMMRIVKDHKVFWATLPIELPGDDGKTVKVGMSLVLVGTESENAKAESPDVEFNVFDRLYELAQWLTSVEEPLYRFEINRYDNFVVYLPEDIKTKRNNFVVAIRILHNDEFKLPLDQKQLKVLSDLEKKLKSIGSPKEHWKNHPTNM